ncbi:unnamed protein product, partial [Allacma fusca]
MDKSTQLVWLPAFPNRDRHHLPLPVLQLLQLLPLALLV